jgi:hypothetical protein
MTVTLQHHRLGLTWIEETRMHRSAHALRSDGRVWLIDPFEDGQALEAAAELGDPAGVVQLLDRHNRDCSAIAAALGVPLLRLPERAPESAPYEVVPLIRRPGWKEIALWWPEERALVVAEAIGTADAFALGRPAGVHPLLRLTPPRSQLARYEPTMLLVGHGRTLESDGATAIADALSRSRADIPKLLLALPKLIRS